MVDPETGEEVAPGEVGELQLRGGGLMTGFYKVDRDEVFTPDGFYPTKDLVRIDADGYLWFVGRTGDMIKTSSANVSRLEVEAALNALPEVALSLVAGLPDPDLGELVVAAVIPAPGAEPTEDGLRAALRDRLSSFKIPRRIVFITARRRSADADRQGAPVRPGDDDRGAPGRRPGRGGPMVTLTNARVFDGRAMLPGPPRRDPRRQADRLHRRAHRFAVGRGGRRRRHDRAPRAHHAVTCTPTSTSSTIGAGEQPGKELPPGVMMAIGVRTCRVLLESGFTGYVGASCAHDIDAQLKMAIAQDIIPGPRIRACGHHIGTTGDMNNRPPWWKAYETPGVDIAADGPDELRKLVRQEIARGVETIKIFASAGHGAAQPHDAEHVARRDRHDRRDRARARREGPGPCGRPGR